MTPTTTASPAHRTDPVRRPRRLRRAALLLGTVPLLLTSCTGGSDGTTAATLPEVKLVTLQSGKPTTWGDERTPLIVNLWASWCVPCRTEMPALDQVAQQLDGRVRFVGVTDDPDRTAAKKAAAASGVSYPLKVDVDQKLMVDLHIAGLPATVFVDADGKIIGRHTGALTATELRKEIKKRYGITT